MILARHLQQARIEDEISRHAGQFGWPQSKHLTLRIGHSGRLNIRESSYFVLFPLSMCLTGHRGR